MADIRFLVNLSGRSEWPPGLSLSSIGKGSGLFVFFAGATPSKSYWTDWGGYYDTPRRTEVNLFFEKYLIRVNELSEVIAHEGRFFVSGDFVTFNLGKKPWQCLFSLSKLSILFGYQSAVADSSRPSDDFYIDATGVKIRYPVRLKVPSVASKLSDSISGIALLQTNKFTLTNNDGLFDHIRDYHFQNSFVDLRKSAAPVPTYADYKIIRRGTVDAVKVTAQAIEFRVGDALRRLTQGVCRLITRAEFPDADPDALGKNLPIGYGKLKKVPLMQVGPSRFIALDPAYITAVRWVYDEDGMAIPYTVHDGVITSAVNAAAADIEARADNRIGQIIIAEVSEKTEIKYIATNWDLIETGEYAEDSPRVNYYRKTGTIRDLIIDILKNDNAFFITKTNGLVTLRRFARLYAVHSIPSWQIMSVPTKDTDMSVRFYASRIRINYDFDIESNTFKKTYINDSREAELKEEFQKEREGSFDVFLSEDSEIESLSADLLDRFGGYFEDVKIKLGYNTAEINLLDTVKIDVRINGRQFSRNKIWVVTGINPAQDELTLSESGALEEKDLIKPRTGDGYGIAAYGVAAYEGDSFIPVPDFRRNVGYGSAEFGEVNYG